MKPITQALHQRVPLAETFPAVTPIFQASAFQAQSPYFYSRKANPNVVEWEGVVKTLEGAEFGLACTTGMTAISLALSLLKPGDRLAVNALIYGCSYKLFQRLVEQRGIVVDVVDLTRPDAVNLAADTAMVFLETPTNPFLRTVDIQRTAARVKAVNPAALVVVDNTWATPLFQRPLEVGADISLHSATKFLSGHSDVMGGIVLTAREDLHTRMSDERFYTGATLDPHSAWLLRRSFQTFELRMRSHRDVTLRMRDFLSAQPQISQVFFPEIDGVQLKGYGGILFFTLCKELAERYLAFRDALKLFDTGTGMAAVTSMVAQPYSGSHASMNAQEKAAMGLGPDLVRLCFGLEDPDDLEEDLKRALRVMEQA